MVKHDSKLTTEIRRLVHLAIDRTDGDYREMKDISVADELDTIIGNLKEHRCLAYVQSWLHIAAPFFSGAS